MLGHSVNMGIGCERSRGDRLLHAEELGALEGWVEVREATKEGPEEGVWLLPFKGMKVQ